MSLQDIHLAQSIARERERDTIRRLEHRRAEHQRAALPASTPRPALARLWRSVMAHLHLTGSTAR